MQSLSASCRSTPPNERAEPRAISPSIAMQIVGRYWDEQTVYRVARAHERTADEPGRRPPLA